MRYRLPLGILIGLMGSAVVLSIVDGHGGRFQDDRSVRGTLASDCDGAIRELVIHYVAAAGDIVVPTYDEFLRQLPEDVTVHVVCPDQADFDDLSARLGAIDCTLSSVIVDHPITPWSRDRWLALATSEDHPATLLLSPRAEMAAAVWPARQGDQQVGGDLALALGARVLARRSELYFDGGDFVADRETAFVTPAVLLRNLQHTVHTREELIARLEEILGRDIVLLREAPDHHAGMYMMAVGDRTVLVGDPAAGERLLEGSPSGTLDGFCHGEGPDFSTETIGRFDAVAEQCQAAGYRVVRIPIIPGRDGRTYLTPLNVILDQRDGTRIVYMPIFSEVPSLNQAAREVWTELGYEVRPVNCDGCYPHFGSLRCLVNVLRRAG